MQMVALKQRYLQLINEELPAQFTRPVRFNHCFARIVLDGLFQNAWYRHLSRKQPAYQQLSETQLQQAIERMEAWQKQPDLLVQDNEASLRYRGKLK